jgi:hypothetical protein
MFARAMSKHVPSDQSHAPPAVVHDAMSRYAAHPCVANEHTPAS